MVTVLHVILFISGGIIVGFVSDLLNARAITCAIMLLLAIPLVNNNYNVVSINLIANDDANIHDH